MASLKVHTPGRKRAGSLGVDASVFEAPVREHLLHAEVRRQLGARRRGTHATKNRSAVSGGGAKPYRQKGTGRARQGTTRAPQFTGGGVVFGPVPRSYEHALNKKTRRAALRSALSLRFRDGAVSAVESLELPGFRTRAMAELLRGLGFGPDEGVLIVTEGADERAERSARNLPWAQVLRAEGLNVYDVLRYPKLLFTRAAVAAVEARLAGRAAAAEEGA